VVVNNLVGVAFATGAAHLMSDGTPWRPLVHVLDISNAFLAALQAPRDLVHNQAFNVGRTEENYRIRQVAELVREVVPGSKVTFAEGAGPDLRCYRVDCAKLAELPGVELRWTVRQGVEQLYAAFKEHGLDAGDLGSWRFQRIARIRALLEAGRLGPDLRWHTA
jgi:nucleoside-diphosphate-sugar epimerase